MKQRVSISGDLFTDNYRILRLIIIEGNKSDRQLIDTSK